MKLFYQAKIKEYLLTYSNIDDSIINDIKVGLSPSKKILLFASTKTLLKWWKKNAFHFILKALFVLKIINFFSWLFGHVEKTGRLERQGFNFNVYMTS